jgi:hypothetical protein
VALYIYREGRSNPIRSWNPYKYVKIQLLTRILDGRGGLIANGMRSKWLRDVQIFQKSYLLRLDSELDVLYMDLDLLDENYPMMKYKLLFEDFWQGGLTAWDHRLDRPT